MIAKNSGIKVGSIIRQDYKDYAGNIAFGNGYLLEVVSVNDEDIQATYWDITRCKVFENNAPHRLDWLQLKSDIWNIIFP